ncbi:MAG: putative metal-dependent hydrolase [Candidatus Nomurabacteria bacterium]|nr:putative metal-dependent hydrolase [Candidatus Nomurabacteria bacterium]
MIKNALYNKYKEQARFLVHERLEHFNAHYNFTYHRVSIRNQKTRWGSCSNKGNLNFSYRILFLEPEAQDYLIVHELCHLKEFNHSQRFWDLVSEQSPNYKKYHLELRHKSNFKILYTAWKQSLFNL